MGIGILGAQYTLLLLRMLSVVCLESGFKQLSVTDYGGVENAVEEAEHSLSSYF